ncbi:sigma-70 family RNA polymerase sigma factor [Altererythrobacter sp. ZODW24]|uniref:sigma-70 family RNA polymerase sigma factor n=1 Tax=Altererythrobacter sp. ZODW24 TaxID=2185142 RepID=UPI000DF81B99|nr:sigma-70 family RNA polymerase sigma factor [Altererythrobacter sp. ZODW24]
MKADDATLRGLMAKAQAGDQTAYRAVLGVCQDWLKRYYAHRIAPSAIDDLMQETLMSLHKKRASYDPSRAFLPWLAAIARYRWVDQLRKTYRDASDELHEDTATTEPEEEAVMAKISIDRLMAHLSPPQVTAIQLVKIDGLTISEASGRCGQSESAIKVNIHRGVKKLSALIESE